MSKAPSPVPTKEEELQRKRISYGRPKITKERKKELLEIQNKIQDKKNQAIANKTRGRLQRVDPTRNRMATVVYKENKKKIRKEFSNSVCRAVLLKQKALCAVCKKFYKTWDFDHIDEDRSNNEQSNCQALCRNCHGEKSRKNRIYHE